MTDTHPFPRLSLSLAELEAILPACLRQASQWVNWKAKQVRDRDGNVRWTKAPVNPHTRDMAEANNPSTWATFQRAVEVHHATPWSLGIGFEFSDSDPFVGVDMDHCINSSGEISAWAQRILEHHPTYAEVSPSGTGIKLIAQTGSPIGKGRKASGYPEPGCAVEVYDRGRFFTITGATLGFHQDVVDCTEAVATLLAGLPTREKPTRAAVAPPPPLDMDDNELVTRAMAAKNGAALRRLWEGDITGYGSQSEADLALCSLLAFWTGPDPDRVDRLFRQSGLAREKWEREDYRQDTLARAVQRNAFYDPPRPVAVAPPAATTTTVGGHPEQPVMASDEEAYFESLMASPEPPGTPPPPTSPRATQRQELPPVIPQKPVGVLASDLLNQDQPPINWAVEDMLPEGMALFSGRPKTGKSWIALQIAIAIANGEHLWGYHAIIGSVLYLALEDGPRRMKSRLSLLVPEAHRRAGLRRLHLYYKWPRWDQGGREMIEDWLRGHDDARLVIVDVWKKLAPSKTKTNSSEYDEEYLVLGPLQSMMIQHSVGMMLITHNRKPAKDVVDRDFLDEVIGSTAITGAADTVMGFSRARGAQEAKLEIASRDFPDIELELVRNDDQVPGWQRQSAEDKALHNPLAKAVIDLTMERGEWCGKTRDLLAELDTRTEGRKPLWWPLDARKLGMQLRHLYALLWDAGVDYQKTHEKEGNGVKLVVRPSGPLNSNIGCSGYSRCSPGSANPHQDRAEEVNTLAGGCSQVFTGGQAGVNTREHHGEGCSPANPHGYEPVNTLNTVNTPSLFQMDY